MIQNPMFEYQTQGDTFCIRLLVPRLDLESSFPLKTQILEILDEQRARIELDLSNVSFMDSSGVGALITIHQKVSEWKGGVRIVNAQPRILSVFELLRLQRVFEIVRS